MAPASVLLIRAVISKTLAEANEPAGPATRMREQKISGLCILNLETRCIPLKVATVVGRVGSRRHLKPHIHIGLATVHDSHKFMTVLFYCCKVIFFAMY